MANLPLTLLGIRHDADGTYVVSDANGTEHVAGDAVGLGRLVARLVDDPEIPRTSPQSVEHNPVIEVAARVARRVAPQHRGALDILEPAVHLVTNKLAEATAEVRRRPARKRSQRRSQRM